MIQGGYFRDSLRTLLRKVFNCHFLHEVSVGTSWQSYLGLDMYSLFMSVGMRPPTQEAWYLLNSEYPPLHREVLYPEDWYKYKTLRSIGQRDRINEWFIEQKGMLAPKSRL